MNGKKTFTLFVVCTVATLGAGTPMPAVASTPSGGIVKYFVDFGDGVTEAYNRPFKSANPNLFSLEEDSFIFSTTASGFGAVRQSIQVIRDPSIATSLEIINTSTDPLPLISTLEFPINPLVANTISAELVVELIDANSDGQASIVGNAGSGDSIQVVTVAGAAIGPPLGTDIMSPGVHSFVLDPVNGPTPIGNLLSLNTNFSLSPGDTVRITSRFIIDEGTGIPVADFLPLPDPVDGPYFNVIDVNSPETSIGNDGAIGARTQLNLMAGGSIGTNFSAGDSLFFTPDIEVNISGGTLGDDFRAFNETVVNISGGATEDVFILGQSVANVSGGDVGFLRVFSGAANVSAGTIAGLSIDEGQLTISGGTIDSSVNADGGVTTITGGSFNGVTALRANGGTVNISGGTFAGDCSLCATTAGSGSVVNISGGSFGTNFNGLLAAAGAEAEFNIYGGTFTPRIVVGAANSLHFVGTEFLLDGVPIDGLVYGEAFEITGRDVTLTGLLADGSPLSFDLNSVLTPGEDHLGFGALLTVTLILPGDYNDDGKVDAADYTVWRDNLGSDAALANDITPWEVGPGDYALWKANFGNPAGNGAGALADGAHAAVPEPATLVLLTFSAVGWCLWRRRAA